MADDNKKPSKATIKKKTYTLKIPVSVNGKQLSPGDKIELTDEGARAFRHKHRI